MKVQFSLRRCHVPALGAHDLLLPRVDFVNMHRDFILRQNFVTLDANSQIRVVLFLEVRIEHPPRLQLNTALRTLARLLRVVEHLMFGDMFIVILPALVNLAAQIALDQRAFFLAFGARVFSVD